MPQPESSNGPSRFRYFMIRVERGSAPDPSPSILGVVERLGTGEKKTFHGGEALLDLVTNWEDT